MPKRANAATIREPVIPWGAKETQSKRGKATSPPPKIKNLPPGLISFKFILRSANWRGMIRAKIALADIISSAILTMCFVL